MKNLTNDFESTRITEPNSKDLGSNFDPLDVQKRSTRKKPLTTPSQKTGSSRKKPVSTAKKTTRQVPSSDDSDEEYFPVTKTRMKIPVKRVVQTPKTPSYLEICDSDTPSESETSSASDDDADQTWNASSDEEYENEQERIKRFSIARKSHKFEKIIFVPDETIDDREKKIDELDRFDYKKPAGLFTPKVTKKKLFTHSHYSDESPPVEEPLPIKEKENEVPVINTRDIFFRSPFPVPKKGLEVKTPRRTPKARAPTPRSKTKSKAPSNVSSYGFLKSLDNDADPFLCDPDAFELRRNYKSKKEELTGILFKMYNEKVFDGQLSDVPVKWNKKLLNTAGRCNNSRRKGIRHSQLELSDKVLTQAERLRCTLIHEMCHAATWVSCSLNRSESGPPTSFF